MVKKPYHHGDLANALLESAEALLAENGLAGFTLRACARRAGVSHAAPAHHFGDVKGLLTAVASRGFAALYDTLSSRIEPVRGDLQAEFIATARAYAEFAEERPEHFRIMFRCDLLDVNAPALHNAMGDAFCTLTNVIRRQRGEPEITPADLESFHATDLINDILIGWSFVHGFAHLQLEAQLGIIPAGMKDDMRDKAALRLSALIRNV